MRAIAVFCGSNVGLGDVYRVGAAALGTALAKRGIRLVYGGTHKGLMGVLADTALANGGEVEGIIPQHLFDKGHLHVGLTRYHVVATMRERKAEMAACADGFIALPGGLGTIEEFFEVATLTQLKVHSKCCALFNINGFYDPLRKLFDHLVAQRFLRVEHAEMFPMEADIDRLLDAMTVWRPPTVEKWFKSEQL